jgi:hypothetical protein
MTNALRIPSLWRQNGAMPSVQIKDVPPETHAVLVRRAAAAHQSLQEYLRSRLIAEAAAPTMDEVLARIERRRGISITADEINELIRAERDSR